MAELNKMDLSRSDLKGLDLKRKDLSNANLEFSDLSGADLSFTNLDGARLNGANLTRAILNKTNLTNVTARNAIFKNARFNNCIMMSSYMVDADFNSAVFSHSLADNSSFVYCNFKDAILDKTSLIDCFFSHADMTNASITASSLINSDFSNAILDSTIFNHSNLAYTVFDHNLSAEYRCGKILDEPIMGYKKAVKNASIKINGKIYNQKISVIVTLEIPKGAIVFSINGSKCRTNRAKVLEIEYLVETDEYLRSIIPKNEKEYTMISEIKEEPAHSMYDHEFYYIKGEEIEIKNFDLNYNVECTQGIHFFLTKREAIGFIY